MDSQGFKRLLQDLKLHVLHNRCTGHKRRGFSFVTSRDQRTCILHSDIHYNSVHYKRIPLYNQSWNRAGLENGLGRACVSIGVERKGPNQFISQKS